MFPGASPAARRSDIFRIVSVFILFTSPPVSAAAIARIVTSSAWVPEPFFAASYVSRSHLTAARMRSDVRSKSTHFMYPSAIAGSAPPRRNDGRSRRKASVIYMARSITFRRAEGRPVFNIVRSFRIIYHSCMCIQNILCEKS